MKKSVVAFVFLLALAAMPAHAGVLRFAAHHAYHCGMKPAGHAGMALLKGAKKVLI